MQHSWPPGMDGANWTVLREQTFARDDFIIFGLPLRQCMAVGPEDDGGGSGGLF